MWTALCKDHGGLGKEVREIFLSEKNIYEYERVRTEECNDSASEV